MKKKVLSIAMAGALCVLSCSAGAKAADKTVATPAPDAGTYSSEVTVTTDAKVPTINITVPGDDTVIINPYKMQANLSDVSGDSLKEQLVNAGKTITNGSDVQIAVSATVSAKPSDNSAAVLATAPLKGSETTKSIFSYLEVISKDSSSAATTGYKGSYDKSAANQVIFASKSTTKNNLVVLKESSSSTGKWAEFKVFGQAATAPAKPWTSADKVDFKITFGFDPVVTTA